MAVVPPAKVFFAAATTFLTATAVGQTILSTAINYSLGAIFKALSGKEDNSAGGAAAREILVRGTTEPQQIIYGEIRTSGYVVFVGCSGLDNEHLRFVGV